jgi:two-component system sensor histidine kinase ChvG
MRGTARTFLSRMWVRVLAFNVLVVFVPIAGLLSLGTYERQLLRSLERSLVQQGRVLAAALEDSGPRLRENSLNVLRHMRQRHDARLRVVDSRGALLADSAAIGASAAQVSASPASPVSPASPAEPPVARAAQETFLYRLASFPIRMWRKYLHPPQPPTESDEFYGGARVLNGPEIQDALSGQYGAAIRVSSGQQSLTLYSAIPVPDRGRVAGAVLVSQSTYRMLSDLYALRLDIFRLFLWSVATAVVLSLLVSATITVPISRLRDQAHAILDPRGRLLGGIVASRARDEVGELSRSLGELTARLQRHVRQMESFASDVSHEFKNPLASIRSAAEIANSSRDSGERREMLAMILDDVRRMERLLTGVREISRIDGGDADGEKDTAADVKAVALGVVSAAGRRAPDAPVTFIVDGEGATAWIPPGRLEQVVENLLDNAAGFSPPGGVVRISIRTEGGEAVLRVSDDGPGIPPEHRDRIFDRFFSFRPGEKKGTHAGLGLSIVKAIVESHGGTVVVDAMPAGGAVFEVRLPASR